MALDIALAECDVPEAAIVEGAAMVLLGRTLDASQRVVARDTFRAMLRAIASPERYGDRNASPPETNDVEPEASGSLHTPIIS